MKSIVKNVAIIFAYLLIVQSCNHLDSSISRKEMRSILEQRNEELADCFKSGDANRLALMYADSAKLSPNGLDFIIGRDSIRAFWAEDFKTSKVEEMVTNILTIDGNSNVIYETGIANSKIIYNDSLYNAKVKYVNIWRKQADGQYLLDVDFWNKPR